MWFAKWFGGRASEEDEPARFTPTVTLRVESGKASRPVGHSAQAAGQSDQTSGKRASGKSSSSKKGFDPYNSGAFERRNAWERVGRR